jgi:hypothetical protein
MLKDADNPEQDIQSHIQKLLEYLDTTLESENEAEVADSVDSANT